MSSQDKTDRITLCVCGRSTYPKAHCVSCGSFSVYAVMRMDLVSNVLVDGVMTKKRIRGFRCKSCGVEFRENSECTAPRGLDGQHVVSRGGKSSVGNAEEIVMDAMRAKIRSEPEKLISFTKAMLRGKSLIGVQRDNAIAKLRELGVPESELVEFTQYRRED